MRIDQQTMEYLAGRTFDTGKIFDFLQMGKKDETRITMTEKLLRSRKVLHLGACDHIECIDEKRRNMTWMHGILCQIAKKIIGIDINEEAVVYCNTRGIDNIFCADITKEIDTVKKHLKTVGGGKEKYWLYAGELLEHLSDPVDFLSCIQSNYSDMIDKIVITVPNAFRLDNFRFALNGQEGINTDHRHWFSPFTLSKICTDAACIVEEVYLVDYASGRLAKLLHKKWPQNLFYNNIVLVARLEN